jgi:hypothetical protein
MPTSKTPEQILIELDRAIADARANSDAGPISRLKAVHAEALEVEKAFDYQPGEGRKHRQTRLALLRKIKSADRLLKRARDFDTTIIKLEQLRDASCRLFADIGTGKLKPGSKELRDRKRTINKGLDDIRNKLRKA